MSEISMELYIVPNKQACLFLKVEDQVLWERYWVQPFEMLKLAAQIADLLMHIDKNFTLVTKP